MLFRSEYIPAALEQFESNPQYYQSRYDSTISWITKYNHAIISNGPFYLESYSPEARTIAIRSFNDPTYPFEAGHWKEFEDVKLAKINRVDVPTTISIGKDLAIPVSLDSDSTLYYYFTNADGKVVVSGSEKAAAGNEEIKLSGKQTSLFSLGANDLKIFAVSESALRPDIFHTSFLAIKGENQLTPQELTSVSETLPIEPNYLLATLAIMALVLGIAVILQRRKQSKEQYLSADFKR